MFVRFSVLTKGAGGNSMVGYFFTVFEKMTNFSNETTFFYFYANENLSMMSIFLLSIDFK